MNTENVNIKRAYLYGYLHRIIRAYDVNTVIFPKNDQSDSIKKLIKDEYDYDCIEFDKRYYKIGCVELLNELQ
jgi:hypothetical protein